MEVNTCQGAHAHVELVFPSPVWVLGLELRLLGLVANTFTHRAISTDLNSVVLFYFITGSS